MDVNKKSSQSEDLDIDKLTLKQADAEQRFGRIVIAWQPIQDRPVVQMGVLLRYFFPIHVRHMGDGVYCYLGFSPLFRSLKGFLAEKEIDPKDIPFYTMEQTDDGMVVATEQEVKQQIIQKPTKDDIKKYGK